MWTQELTEAAPTEFGRMWQFRHLMLHLASSDLRGRFRRSYLGIVWAMLQPLLLCTIMSLVLAVVFNQPFREYSVYVYSGLISWEIVASAFGLGAAALVGAEGYLKQSRIPIALFGLKAMVHATVIFGVSLIGFALYCALVLPGVFSATWLLLPLFVVLALVLATPFAIISSIINMKVRDYQQGIGLVLQSVWYVSPVFVAREVFDKAPLATFTHYNFVASYVDIFRAIVVAGEWPDTHDLTVVCVWAAVFWVIAVWVVRRNQDRIVYYF